MKTKSLLCSLVLISGLCEAGFVRQEESLNNDTAAGATVLGGSYGGG